MDVNRAIEVSNVTVGTESCALCAEDGSPNNTIGNLPSVLPDLSDGTMSAKGTRNEERKCTERRWNTFVCGGNRFVLLEIRPLNRNCFVITVLLGMVR